RRAATTASASVPTCRLVAPTGLAGSAAGLQADVSPLIDVVPDRDASRPRGKRFGTLLHATLADVALEADAPSVASLAANLGRVLGATDEEVAAATAATVGALRHPLLRRAAASADCRRE